MLIFWNGGNITYFAVLALCSLHKYLIIQALLIHVAVTIWCIATKWHSPLLFVQVEVRMREGHAVNIHMFCARRPGILMSTLRALDSLGLGIEQAVISCFNGFAMDVFRAEVCILHIIIFFSSSWGFFFSCVRSDPTVVHSLNACSVLLFCQQCRDGPGLGPEEIKTVLLHSAGLQNAM